MPVLGKDDVVELHCESIDARQDDIAFVDGQRAAGKEVALHVDDEEGVGGAKLHSSKRTILCKGSA
jgi:hypothetical protein